MNFAHLVETHDLNFSIRAELINEQIGSLLYALGILKDAESINKIRIAGIPESGGVPITVRTREDKEVKVDINHGKGKEG